MTTLAPLGLALSTAPRWRDVAALVLSLVLASLLLTPAGSGAHGGTRPVRIPRRHRLPKPAVAAPGTAATTGGTPIPVAYRVRADARADLGWTGIAHNQVWPAEQRLAFALDCSAGGESCRAIGGSPGDFFGAPVPLSSGGVPACIVNRLRAGVAGTVQPKTGCGELELHLGSTVYATDDIARPCPVCIGDATPNDGKKDGHCDGGAATGRACDAQTSPSQFGVSSNDCLPVAGKNVGELPIDLTPLTTGHASLTAKLSCKAVTGKDAPRCFCPAQTQATACSGAPCSADGRCLEGPIDGVCSLASYRGCRLDSGREECDAVAPGSGECQAVPRPCFGATLEATGSCDPKTPTYVAVFCAAATRAPTLNAAAGLPGPTRLVLPLERVD